MFKNKNKLLITFSVGMLVLGATLMIYYFLKPAPQAVVKSKSQKSQFESRQKIPKNGFKNLNSGVITKNSHRSRAPQRSPATKKRDKRIRATNYESKLKQHLNESKGGYSWSTTAYAFLPTKVVSASAKKITSAIGVDFYEYDIKSDDNFFIVKDPVTKRIGFYSGKVVVNINENKVELENFLSKTSYNWNKVIETYILDVNSIEEAIEIKEEVASLFPLSDVYLNIITNRIMPN